MALCAASAAGQDVKRIRETTEEDLRRQLLRVPEIGLEQPAVARMYAPLLKAMKSLKRDEGLPPVRPDYGLAFFAQVAGKQSGHLTGLPWRRLEEAPLGKEAAERLQVLSNRLRDAMRKATPPGDVRPDAGKVYAELKGDPEWQSPEAIPTLLQLLQAENEPLRGLLVDMLARIDGKAASVALAERAMYDLSAEVRAQAIARLSRQPIIATHW
jgi:hypothetical protein